MPNKPPGFVCPKSEPPPKVSPVLVPNKKKHTHKQKHNIVNFESLEFLTPGKKDLPRPDDETGAAPNENPVVCPAGFKDELNNDVLVFGAVPKPVVAPNDDAVVAPKAGVVPNPVVPIGFAPKTEVPVFAGAAWPKAPKPEFDVAVLKAGLF